MSTEHMKAAMRRLYDEVFNAGRLDIVPEIVAPGCVDHEQPGGPAGPQALIEVVQRLRGAFPDLRMESHDMIAEGDRVVTRTTMTGTHTGDFYGMPPTGKGVRIDGMDISRFEGGLIVEHWGISDAMSLMQQLGAIPEE